MNFKNQTLFRIGMLLLLVSVLSLRFVHAGYGVSEDVADLVRGLLFGISIAFNLWVVVRRSCERKACKG